MMPWEKPVQEPEGVPPELRRDENNVAPYMRKPSPANNPLASPPNWVPPWHSKSGPHSA